MSAEKVTEDLAQVSLEGDVEPQTADGAEAIYTSESRGSDESGKLNKRVLEIGLCLQLFHWQRFQNFLDC